MNNFIRKSRFHPKSWSDAAENEHKNARVLVVKNIHYKIIDYYYNYYRLIRKEI